MREIDSIEIRAKIIVKFTRRILKFLSSDVNIIVPSSTMRNWTKEKKRNFRWIVCHNLWM